MADEQPDRVSVPTLVMTGGPLDGTAYPLQLTGREIIIGSSLDADVQILLGNVESFHSRIGIEAGALVISDAGSATGTFVNGEKIEDAHPLQEGDRICLGPPGAKGSAKVVVRMPGSSPSAAARGAEASGPEPADDGPAPVFEEPSLFLGSQGDVGLPPTFELPSEHAEAEPRSIVEDSAGGEEIGLVAAEEGEDDGSLFGSPLPTSPVMKAARAASSGEPALPSLDDESPLPAFGTEPETASPRPAAPAGAPPAAPAPPPAVTAPAAAAPPPPPPGPPLKPAGQRLTAPPPPPPAPSRPDYQSDLPSIPVPGRDEPRPEPFPPLRPMGRPAARPAARPAPARRRPAARRKRGFSLPSVPLPLIGGVLALALLAGLVYLLYPRPKPPELLSITPSKVEAGQTVTLSGTHFAKEPVGNTVLFGATRGTVSAASDGELKVIVPPNAKAQLDVTVETKGGRSKPVRLEVLPVATASAVDPEVALPGQSVTIRGEGFAGQRVTVRFAGLPATSVEQVPGGIKAVVPQIAFPEGSATTVTVEIGGQPPLSFPFIVGQTAPRPRGKPGERRDRRQRSSSRAAASLPSREATASRSAEDPPWS